MQEILKMGKTFMENTISHEVLKVVEKWVTNPARISTEEKQQLTKLAASSLTDRDNLERIYHEDPEYSVGEAIKLRLTSFTGVHVSKNEKAGEIAWKTNDGALAKIINPKRGFDIPYSLIKTKFSAQAEKETLIAGRYVVTQVLRVTEPFTNPQYEYWVKQYILKEI